MAQGVGAILGGPAAAYLVAATGTWAPVSFIVAAFITTALLAHFVLRPMRRRWVAAPQDAATV